MPLTKFLTHLRRNVVAYLALVVALGTSTAYAAGSIPDGSVTAAKLHKNAVTSNKIKDGTVKNKDIKKPTYVQSTNRRSATRRRRCRIWSAWLPTTSRCRNKGRTSVTVFIPRSSAATATTETPPPTIGLYIDNGPIAGTAANVPGAATTRPIQLTATLQLNGGAHAGQVGITCSGASAPNDGHRRQSWSSSRPTEVHRGRETPHPARASGSGCGGSRQA